MSHKRKTSALIPYKIQNNKVIVYLQKRSENIERSPGHFGFFGGGAEYDENPQQTLEREIQEEMNFRPEAYTLFRIYEFEIGTAHVFLLEVDETCEEKIKISEGEYGKWFTETDVLNEPKVVPWDNIILKDLYKSFKKTS